MAVCDIPTNAVQMWIPFIFLESTLDSLKTMVPVGMGNIVYKAISSFLMLDILSN